MKSARIIALCVAFLSLSACDTLQGSTIARGAVCPAVHEWSKDDQKRLDAFYLALSGPDKELVRAVFREWISLHQQAKACKADS